MTAARSGASATVLANGKVLLAGGQLSDATSELFDPVSGQFTLSGKMAVPRIYNTATLLADGQVLAVGGNEPGGRADISAELYDPVAGTWRTTGSPLRALTDCSAAARLPDGRVLFVGATEAREVAPGRVANSPVATAQLYDEATGKFTVTGSMFQARCGPSVIPLRDGRVLVAGGATMGRYDAGTETMSFVPLASAEIYDPGTGRFALTGTMSVGRKLAIAAALPDGRVLIAGGCSNADTEAGLWCTASGFLSSAELYDPSMGVFSPTGSMAHIRDMGVAVAVLANGRVLLAGAEQLVPNGPDHQRISFTTDTEIFDPVTNIFVPSGAVLAQGRRVPSVAVLSDGRVLIAGGDIDDNPADSAELFVP